MPYPDKPKDKEKGYEVYRDAEGATQLRETGMDADAVAVDAKQQVDLAAASGASDPYAPTVDDFPNAGGLAGAAGREKAYRDALARYRSDPEFRKQFAAAKKKAMEEAQAARARSLGERARTSNAASMRQ